MKRIHLLVSALALAGCTDTIADELSDARSQLEQDQQQHDNTKSACEFGPLPSVEDIREEALAEWDIAAGSSLDNISPEQEWEIRKSLAAEMGLAPSEVDGWRDIYRGRAEQAKRVLENRKSSSVDEELRARERKAACGSLSESEKVLQSQKAVVAQLERELEESVNAPSLFTFIAYGFLVLFGIGVLGWVAISVIDGRAKRQLAETLKQIQLDGLLRQAQIFFDQLPAATRQAIVDAHARRDVSALSTLISESAPSHLREHIL